MRTVEDNIAVNQQRFDEAYANVDRQTILERAGDPRAFLDWVVQGHGDWRSLASDGFYDSLEGKRVLELGSGNGLNALIMAKLGAQVTAIDIASQSKVVIDELATELGISDRVTAWAGDFVEFEVTEPFDVVVGKAFLHHLNHEQEERYVQRCAQVLADHGHARFYEPAVNSPALDKLRLMVPVPGRPSSLNADAYSAWKAEDPHPDRDNSTDRYVGVTERYFGDVQITLSGGLDRLTRFVPEGPASQRFRSLTYSLDEWLPRSVRHRMARGQLIVCRSPKRS